MTLFRGIPSPAGACRLVRAGQPGRMRVSSPTGTAFHGFGRIGTDAAGSFRFAAVKQGTRVPFVYRFGIRLQGTGETAFFDL